MSTVDPARPPDIVLLAPTREEEAVLAELIAWARWPDTGFLCPCGCRFGVPIKGRPRMRMCRACRRQNSVLAGTALHKTKLRLRVWFARGEYEAKDGTVTTREHARHLGIAPSTAWTLEHRMMRMVATTNHDKGLEAVVFPIQVRRPHPRRPLRPEAPKALRDLEHAWRTLDPAEPRTVTVGLRKTHPTEAYLDTIAGVPVASCREGPVPLETPPPEVQMLGSSERLPIGFEVAYHLVRVLEETRQKVSLRWLPRWVAGETCRWNVPIQANRKQSIAWVRAFATSTYRPLHDLAPTEASP